MTAWRWCAVFAFVMLGISMSFGQIQNIDACGPGPAGEPILSLEFVTSPDQVASLFLDHCKSTLAYAHNKGLWIDILGFVPAYLLTLITAFVALAKDADNQGRWIALFGFIAAIIAAICDQVENVQLLRIVDALPGTQDMINILMPAVRAKFALLGVAVSCIGTLIYLGSGWLRYAGLLMLAGGLVSILGLFLDPALVMGGGVVAWPLILVTAVTRSFSRPD